MASKGVLNSLVYALLLATFVIQYCNGKEKKLHIVYMGDRPQGDFFAYASHHSLLQRVLGSAQSAKESLIYSYGRSINGFVAKLSDEEVARIKELESVISVIPDRTVKLHTTRSWDFMGFPQNKAEAPQEGDVIIGLLDTGIWPESPSFSDQDMTTPPAKWKGTCQGLNFTCNNKIIGARHYNITDFSDVNDPEMKSPRDYTGHGTHTASTAAGREIPGASFYGLAEGTARGGIPNARIAVYKVCWRTGCNSAGILAAFDDAIADGVDILSVSLGADDPLQYFEDPIAIGTFHAMKRGILTSASAGNAGSFPHTVANYAPWILTVAASTIDRKFIAQVVLGNGQIYTGLSINGFDLNATSYSLIWGGDAANYSAGGDLYTGRYCFPGRLNSYKVGGNIVLCDDNSFDGYSVLMANGVGAIMADPFLDDIAFSFPLPAVVISAEDRQSLLDYIRSTENPIATILRGETWKDIMAPSVASFSSRGPNRITPDILKPDITAPGVDILAAWSPAAPTSFSDKRSVKFNIISGTSMSCPHVSGAAAFVKATHPSWSPAAIKSALMTTANVMDPNKHDDREFGYGSGHINPLAAVNPGLVYDASEEDYINFLCKQGYNTTTLKLITGSNSSACNTSTNPGRAWDLNYPTFAIAVEDGQPINAIFTRTVTNVGLPNSTYIASWSMPTNFVNISVDPFILSFSNIGEKKTFTVKVDGPIISQQRIKSGEILWKDKTHVVRSPLVVYTVLPGSTNVSRPYDTPELEVPSTYRRNSLLRQNSVSL